MLLRTTAVKIVATLVVMLAVSAHAFAQEDLDSIDLSDHDTSQVSDTADKIQPSVKEGATAAMSGGASIPMCTTNNMFLHMDFTGLRPANEGDQARALVLVTDLQQALARYKDYHVAEADGFKPFHPEIKQQKVVHFTRNWYGLKASFTFNPTEPTSLLYQRTPDGGYKLIGAMYTDRKGATPDELNLRVPLSVARWHRHVNICIPPISTHMKSEDWTKFGPAGSIASKEECDAVGGHFFPQIFGWMVHVYPWETNPQLVWAH
jgi:hypothetical protein